jgi:hypothetical protein
VFGISKKHLRGLTLFDLLSIGSCTVVRRQSALHCERLIFDRYAPGGLDQCWRGIMSYQFPMPLGGFSELSVNGST